jgi:hypothetical protein
MRPSVIAPALLIVVALGLSSCSSDKPENCPDTAVLASTSIVSIVRQGAPLDPANELYTVQLDRVKASCTLSETDRTSDEDITIKFRATRPSAGDAVTYTVPYFVAVASAGNVSMKKSYTVQVSFQAGETSTTFDQDIDDFVVNVDRDKHAIDYEVLVGLQLTKEQLDYNMAHGRFAH